MPSGYKLAIGVCTILVLILVWIGTYEAIGAPNGIIDRIADSNITSDTAVMEKNEIARNVLYWSPLIIIAIIFIWVIKEDTPGYE